MKQEGAGVWGHGFMSLLGGRKNFFFFLFCFLPLNRSGGYGETVLLCCSNGVLNEMMNILKLRLLKMNATSLSKHPPSPGTISFYSLFQLF